MGILDAALDSIGGVLADQWKDVITAPSFKERTVVAPGIRKGSQNGRGANSGAEDVLSSGSIIFVPENTAAFIFSQAGIEQVITSAGGFEYRNGEASVFDEQSRRERGVGRLLFDQTVDRIGHAGMSSTEKRVAFVNLREIRGIKFGTRGPLTYNDLYYGADLEIYSYGSLSLQVTDPELFLRNFVPANLSFYAFDARSARSQLISEFLNSYVAAINSLSQSYRISQLTSQTRAIGDVIAAEEGNVGSWERRFGLRLVSVAIEGIEFSEESRELVRQFSEKKMSVRAFEDVSQHAANVAAQQMIAEGVRNNGLGDGGGMLFGMGLAQSLSPQDASPSGRATRADSRPSLDEQVEAVKKLKELLDAGILSQEEFDAKKRSVLGL